MARNLLGIDFRENGVAVVSASGGARGITIEAGRYIETTPDTDIASALARGIEALQVKGSVTVVSVPGNRVSFRHLSMPFGAPKKIKMVLPSEMEPLLPFPLESVVIDATVILKGTAEENTQIVAAAFHKSALDGYVEKLAACGIQPETVVPGGWVVGHVVAADPRSSDPWMLVDLDAKEGMVVCGVAQKPIGIRGFRIPEGTVDIAGHVYAEARRTVLGISERLSIDLWPEMVWVTGPGVDRLQAGHSDFNAPVEPMDLAHDVRTSVRISPEAGWEPRTMNGALALILSRLRGGPGLSFYSGGIGFGSFFSENGRELKKLAAVAALAAGLGLFNLWFESHAREKKIADLDSTIREVFLKTFPDVQRIVDPLQQMKVKIRELQDASGLESEGAADVRAIDILEMISRDIPQAVDVEMTQLNFSEETVLLAGSTGNFNAVDEIKTSLEKNAAFSAVTITSANMEKSGERVEFKIKVDLAKGG